MIATPVGTFYSVGESSEKYGMDSATEELERKEGAEDNRALVH